MRQNQNPIEKWEGYNSYPAPQRYLRHIQPQKRYSEAKFTVLSATPIIFIYSWLRSFFWTLYVVNLFCFCYSISFFGEVGTRFFYFCFYNFEWCHVFEVWWMLPCVCDLWWVSGTGWVSEWVSEWVNTTNDRSDHVSSGGPQQEYEGGCAAGEMRSLPENRLRDGKDWDWETLVPQELL